MVLVRAVLTLVTVGVACLPKSIGDTATPEAEAALEKPVKSLTARPELSKENLRSRKVLAEIGPLAPVVLALITVMTIVRALTKEVLNVLAMLGAAAVVKRNRLREFCTAGEVF